MHRRGLDALESYRQGELTSGAGPEAAVWLQDLLTAGAAAAPGPQPTTGQGRPPLQRQTPSAEAANVAAAGETCEARQPAPVAPVSGEIERKVVDDVDAAIAAMLASFPELTSAEREEAAAQRIQPGSIEPPLIETPLIETLEPLKSIEPIGDLAPAASGRSFSSEWPSWDLSGTNQPPDQPVASGNGFGPAIAEPVPVPVPAADDGWEAAEPEGEEPIALGGRLRRRLRQRFPAAALKLREVVAAAQPGRWWRSALRIEEMNEGPIDAEGWLEPEPEAQLDQGATASRLEDHLHEADQTRNGSRIEALPFAQASSPRSEAAEPAERPEPPHVPMAHPLDEPETTATAVDPAPVPVSPGDRLRQRLPRPLSGTAAGGSAPAPRPSALADLGAWLPVHDLPRAS